MATNKVKIIKPADEDVKHTRRDNWEVMKPFVSFSFKAVKVIGLTLIAIVQAGLSMLKPHKNNTEVKRR